MKKTRLVLWALDSQLTLESAKEKLSRNYTEVYPDLFQSDLSLEERTFNHHWRIYSDTLLESKMDSRHTKYLLATGVLEIERGPKALRKDSQGKLQPKRHRVKEVEIEGLFLEMDGRVYIVLATPKHLESKVRTRLFLKEHEWGRIDYRELPQYNFGPDFFNWLMLKKGELITDLRGEKLELRDVVGFSGNSGQARGTTTFTGSGGNISSQPATQTMISTASSFNKLTLSLEFKDICFNFELGELAECNIDSDNTYKKNDRESFKHVNVHEAIITIYNEIIPLLKSAFHMEVTNGTFHPRYEVFQKQAGLYVIADIVKQLNLTKGDIDSLDCFSKR